MINYVTFSSILFLHNIILALSIRSMHDIWSLATIQTNLLYKNGNYCTLSLMPVRNGRFQRLIILFFHLIFSCLCKIWWKTSHRTKLEKAASLCFQKNCFPSRCSMRIMWFFNSKIDFFRQTTYSSIWKSSTLLRPSKVFSVSHFHSFHSQYLLDSEDLKAILQFSTLCLLAPCLYKIKKSFSSLCMTPILVLIW